MQLVDESTLKQDGAFCKKISNKKLRTTGAKIEMLKEISRSGVQFDLKDIIRGFDNEQNSMVKREIVSLVGKERSEKNISLLIKFSNNNDPKIVLQALRGMSYFKTNNRIISQLKILGKNKNEIIQEYIITEFLPNNIDKKTKKIHKKIELKESRRKFENLLIQSDVLKTLKKIPDETIDLTFTSPPYYNARDYSVYASYEEYLKFLVKTFKEIYRVTAEGRFFILNTSPVIIPRIGRKYSSKRYAIPFDIHPRLVDLGFEFIDDIVWAKPAPCAKNRNGGFFQHRKPLGYKPNMVTEYVMVYRKKTNKLLDWNMRQYDDKTVADSLVTEDYEKTNLWNIAPTSSKMHPAVFPSKLVEYVIKFYSYCKDLILDPFAGSGTVGTVAHQMDRKFLLIELEKKYATQISNILTTRNITHTFKQRI